MRQVGVKAMERKCARGNQNQNCVNTNIPMTAVMLVWPDLDCRQMDTLRPPASRMPGVK